MEARVVATLSLRPATVVVMEPRGSAFLVGAATAAPTRAAVKRPENFIFTVW